MAMLRSLTLVKVAMMIASVVGISSAAPTPWTARLAMSTSRRPGGQRGQGEDRHADQEQPPPAVHVGEPAADEQQPGQGEQVTADHPLQTGHRQVQAALDGRDRDINHVVVEVGHERGEADRGQRPPPA
jgi:hypothetical protein